MCTLCSLTSVFSFLLVKLEPDDLAKQLSEPFTPDDALMFGSHLVVNLDDLQAIENSKETLSIDEVCSSMIIV